MTFQKFVAWDRLPSLLSEASGKESSSSSNTGSLEENESEFFQKYQDSADDLAVSSIIEIPHSVKNVLNKIDTAQLERAKKDISKKLHHIQEKVHQAYEHYKKDDSFDPELEREYFHTTTWEEKSRRSNLLDDITDSLDQASFKAKELEIVLESLKSWSEMLKIIDLQEKVIPKEDWIDEAEKNLQKRFYAIQQNIVHLIRMCYPFLEEREKTRRKSAVKTGLFKAWRDKVAEKPELAEPLTAEQIVEDEVLTFSLAHEISEMILELVDLSFFHKGEANAIKYIAAMVENLTKAFGLLNRQCRSLKFKLEVGASESRKHDPQVTSLQRELRMIIEKKAALEMQVQKAEERCKILLTTNEAMQKELRSAHERAQMSRTAPSRPPVSKVPQENVKPQEEDGKSVSRTIPLRRPTPSRMFGVATAEFSSVEETKLKSKSEDSDTEKLPADSTTQPQTPLVADTEIQRVMRVQMKEAVPQIVLQEAPEETAPLEKQTVLEFPSENIVKSTPKPKEDRVLPTASQDSKLHEKIKSQTLPLAARTVTESHLPQSSGAGSEDQKITSEGEVSPPSAAEIVHTPSIKEDIDLTAEKLLPEPPTEKAQPPSIQYDEQPTERKSSDGQPTKRKSSLKHSAKKMVQDIKSQKQVKFQSSIPSQGPLSPPDSGEKMHEELPEGSPSEKPVTRVAEDVKSEDAGKIQAQNQQLGGLKEKEEMKDFISIQVEGPTDVSETEAHKSKQAKVIKDVIHELGTQLQEIAREKGGVIEIETIKGLFEKVDMASEDETLGKMSESLPADKLAKAPIVEKPELHEPTSEQLSKPRESTDEASSSQDVRSVMQEFQASILACIEDKLEKVKTVPSESLKQPEKSKPTNPEIQHFCQAIDRKLDECFLAVKHKYKMSIMRRRVSSLKGEEEEKDIKHQPLLGTPPTLSQESSVSSLSVPEEGGEQQLSPKRRKVSKEKLKHLRKAQEAFQDQQEHPEKREDLPKYLQPKEEKRFHLPEVVLRVLETKRQAKEPPLTKKQSLLRTESQQGVWVLRLQERLEWEKERLKEEQLRLQDERQRLDEEEHYLEHWQYLFETQQEQWNHRQQQHQDQEALWIAQLEYWQQQEQDHKEQQQYWQLEQEQHQERLRQLQEELQKLQQQYEQQLLLQKEQTEEQWRWDRLRAMHEEQLHTWQKEDEERERQRRQWQQQLADHERQLKAWQQEKEEQELQYREWQEKQQRELQLWQQSYEEQLQHWERQVQWHQTQQRKQQTQLQKVRERQKQIGNEEKILAPQLKMLETSVQEELAKEIQWAEAAELASQPKMLRTRVQRELVKEIQWPEAAELASQPKMLRTRVQRELAKEIQWPELASQSKMLRTRVQRELAKEVQWPEPSELASQPKMPRTRVLGELAKEVDWQESRELAPQLKMLRTRVQGELAKEVQWQESREPEPPTHKVQLLPTAHVDHLPAIHKTGLLPPTPQLSPEPMEEYLDSFDLDSTLFSKLLSRDDGFATPSVTEKRYSLDVDAQRKNLELLEEANQKAGLDSDLYLKAKETIMQALHSNVERLALLFRKYIAFRRIREIRRIITTWLNAAKDDKDGATMKKLYKVVERLDAYQKKILGNWTSGQKIVEKKRQQNIKNMIALFDQLQLNYRVQLNPPCPLMVKATDTTKETQYMPHMGPVYLKPRVYRSPLFATKKPLTFSAIVSRDEGSEQIESLWQTSITELSVPIGPKTPVSLLWSQAGGFPDIPRLLEFDITSIRNKPLEEIKTRVQSIPRWKISEYKFMHL